jgi:hypothetical protein
MMNHYVYNESLNSNLPIPVYFCHNSVLIWLDYVRQLFFWHDENENWCYIGSLCRLCRCSQRQQVSMPLPALHCNVVLLQHGFICSPFRLFAMEPWECSVDGWEHHNRYIGTVWCIVSDSQNITDIRFYIQNIPDSTMNYNESLHQIWCWADPMWWHLPNGLRFQEMIISSMESSPKDLQWRTSSRCILCHHNYLSKMCNITDIHKW